MKKISREEQMMKNGGRIGAGHEYAAQCTNYRCLESWSSSNRQKVVDKAYDHYKKKLKNNEIHRWNWLRQG